MRLSDIKGQDAFKAMGSLIGYLREMFKDEKLLQVVKEQKIGWMLDFFSVSLEEHSDIWMKMYMVLNPGIKEEDVSMGSVIKFAYEFKNDPELMSLFFSQGDQMENNYSGSPMESIEETGKK